MRYAWEHFSDALLDEEGNWNTDTQMVTEELANARAHLLRRYTDLTEWRYYQIKVFAYNLTKWLKKEEVQLVIPKYYADIFPLFGEVERTIIDLKTKSPEQKFVDKRIELLDQVNDKCEIILAALDESALRELRRKSSAYRAHLLVSLLKFVVTAVASTLIGMLVQYLLQSTP